MTYGDQIKEARIQLGITQKDLVDSGISRVHITDLESGKSKLVKVKAHKIYLQLVFLALSKKIPLHLNFDPLFAKDDHYFHIKRCYEDLRVYIEKDSAVSLEKNNQVFHSHINHDIGPLKFILLSFTGSTYLAFNENTKAYECLKDALNTCKYDLNPTVLPIFQETFTHFRVLCANLCLGHEVLKIYKTLNFYCMVNQVPYKKFTYFNMALFEKINKNYARALEYLNKQVEVEPIISCQDNIDYQITRAAILMHLGHYVDAINIYTTLLTKSKDSIHPKKLSIACSSLIHFIVKYKIHHQAELLQVCNEVLVDLLEDRPHLFKNRFKTYSNLGQVAFYEGAFKKSLDFFNKAFTAYGTSDLNYGVDYITLITEAYPTYMKTGHTSSLYRVLMKFDLAGACDKSRSLYMTLLANLMYNQSTIKDKHFISLMKKNQITTPTSAVTLHKSELG